jgi:hypothetical protein
MVRIEDARQLVAEMPAFRGLTPTKMAMKAVYAGYNLPVWNSWFNWLCVVLRLVLAAMALAYTAYVVQRSQTGALGIVRLNSLHLHRILKHRASQYYAALWLKNGALRQRAWLLVLKS